MKREELTKAQRWAVADRLADERLPKINASLDDVHPRTNLYSKVGKRVIDIVVSGAALIVTFPINLVIGVLTYLDVGSPLFFKQIRTGKDGRPFEIVKFRNMRIEYDKNGDLLPPDQRVTKLGKFVRKTSLDELLNLWSVFKGDMSIIGPRPLVPEYSHRYNKRHVMRLSVRPGLECPPQALDDKVWTWQEQLDNDVWYVENISLRTDCRMIVNLFRFALDRKSANARALSKRGTFMGYSLDGIAINLDQVEQRYIDDAESIGQDFTQIVSSSDK